MGGGKRLTSAATIDKRSDFGLVSRPETIDKFRHCASVVPHRESAPRKRFSAASPCIGLDDDVERALVEMADLDLSFFAEHHGFHPITGDVIAAHLDLGDGLIVKPNMQHR